ncbi:hypothetical protein [Clostridium beijerinckii]|uniref:GH35 family endo-1,4-beta-xylanase n=1 Tax=Clostridium beijerinckii TaxID=1520 RepID=A0A9Q5CM92_CLOBE|nr:hypothetical protein [Clostridium beijerinckii]MBA2884500.1 GH35 family endo-1,4-beta-xylanase [Clostridium beijerinckii]MBA2898130.1 GH35 family endo-1,4-beta-xylanase [Clostridium beijerinckii]MBA2909981.1 GH35 family endo-1,4-beta-xylanase [Clostridium beijerinckii]MBA9012928.1 GH35 family endo-1,4-beta-xylanase [Clostridium beijerinckii]NRT04643.1 GH35 family endo-1,4-beta-xylanase [Clostridium beijerinckii]
MSSIIKYIGCLDSHDLMSAILSSKKSGFNITALVLWGLSDDHSWCSKDEPLL